MKNYFWLAALLCCIHSAHAQTPLKTINYQAIIVDTSAIQSPGGAIQAQLYLKKDVWVKFGIYAEANLHFEELDKFFLNRGVIGGFTFPNYNDNY